VKQPNRRPTQEDVAQALGVDKSTVSLALRNDFRLSRETIAQVKAKARELGYQRDAVLSELAGRRWRRKIGDWRGSTMAMIVAEAARGPTELSDTKRLISGAKERAAELGYHIEVLPSANAKSDAAHGKACYHRGICGLILRNPFLRDEPWALDLRKFSAINLGASPFPAGVDTVMIHRFRTMRECLARCLRTGYRRPGFVLPATTSTHGVIQWTSAFSGFYLANDIPMWPLLRFRPRTTRKETLRILKEWMRQEKPDVIIAPDKSVMDLLEPAGFRIPRDVSFAALQLDRDCAEARGMVAGYLGAEERVTAAGVEWLDMLIRCGIKGVADNTRTLLVPQAFQDGATLPGKR
jgi:DNA-binding LacI/PurR family transcriptional regulator